jgi:hypothetical protein
LIACAAITISHVARAETLAPLRVVAAEDACPASADVALVLSRLLARSPVVASTTPETNADVSIVDDGAEFRVIVAGFEKSFSDPERACGERAREAAVFVALVLDHAAGSSRPSAPAALAPPPPPPEDESDHAPRPPIDLAFGPAFEVAPGAAPFAPGLELRLRHGQWPSLSLGLSGFLPATLDFGPVRADASWFPVDVSVGLVAKRNDLELSWDLGPGAALVSIKGRDLDNSERSVRLELGARTALSARWWLGRQMGVFVSSHVTLLPHPYPVNVEPLGRAGTTPAFWVGGAVGVALRLN